MLSCNDHDYLEIICLFHYKVKAILSSGLVIVGSAADVRINGQREEVLVLKDDTEDKAVLTKDIHKIEVLTPNARFNQVSFLGK